MTDKKAKILFVTFTLSNGGAERQIQHLLNNIDRQKYNPALVLLENTVEYDIPQDIPVVCFNKRNVFDFFRLVFRLARLLKREKPDIAISFLTYPNIVLLFAKLLAGYKKPVIISERTNLEVSLQNIRKSGLKSILIKRLYPLADRLIVISKGVQERIRDAFGMPEEKIQIIYNGVDVEKVRKMVRQKPEIECDLDTPMPKIVTAGRFSKSKGYPDLLKAFKKVLEKRPCHLVIMGRGKLEQEIKQLIATLGIEKNVTLCGFQKNPFAVMANSDMFVLASHWEGFANVIVEAMAAGVPVISTDCNYGPREIVTNEVNGLLVPVGDVEAIVSAIIRLLNDKTLCKHLVDGGIVRANYFNVERMVQKYESVFDEYI